MLSNSNSLVLGLEGYHPHIPQALLVGTVVCCEKVGEEVRIVTTHSPPFHTNALLQAEMEPLDFPPPERASLMAAWLTLCPEPKLPLIDKRKMKRLVSTEFLEDSQNVGEYHLSYDSKKVFLAGHK